MTIWANPAYRSAEVSMGCRKIRSHRRLFGSTWRRQSGSLLSALVAMLSVSALK